MEKLEQGLEKIGFLEYTELPFIKKASAKTKIPAAVIVLTMLLIVVGLLLTPYFSEILSTLIMFTIPSFETFRAIKSKSEKDDEELLTYWIVFGTLYTFDSVFRYLLDFFGWYSIIRLAILMFIFYSRSYGSKLIYVRVIRPFFERFGEVIDKIMQPIEEQGRRISRYIQVQQDEFKKLSNLKESMDDTKEKTE